MREQHEIKQHRPLLLPLHSVALLPALGGGLPTQTRHMHDHAHNPRLACLRLDQQR